MQGSLRDYVSFGLCRFVIYISLCLSYLLFAVAEPGQTDYFQGRFSCNIMGKNAVNIGQNYFHNVDLSEANENDKLLISIFGSFNMLAVSE